MNGDQLAAAMLAIAGAPALPGASCRGRGHLFDPRTRGESDAAIEQRHGQALALCSRCPALADCRAYVDGLAPIDRPHGIVAGRLEAAS